jgi:predicted MFS family arabinose efflux permease
MKNSTKKITLILLALIAITINTDQNIMNATLSEIEKEFSVNDADIGLMSGLFTLLGAIVSLAWGYFADRGDTKKLLILSVLFGEIPCFLTAFSQNYFHFFILRILTGFGVGATFPIIYSIIGDFFNQKERGVATALITASIGLGQIAGMLLSGYLGPSFGWRLPFIAASVPSMPFILLFLFLVPRPQRGGSEESIKELVEQGILYPRKIRLSDYINLAKNKTNVLLFIQGIMGTVPWGAIPLFLVKFLRENKGLTIEQATTVFLLFGIGNILGTVFGGIIGGKLFNIKASYVPLFCSITTFLGTFASLFIFIVIPTGQLMLLVVSGFVASFLVSMTGPNMKKMLLDINVPENRGAIFSIFNLTDSAGTGIGKYLAGILSVAFGLTFSLSVSSIFWIPCAIVLFIACIYFPIDLNLFKSKMEKIAKDMEK